MPQCKRCQAAIRWDGGPGRGWKALNQEDGTPHACLAPKTCRYCEKPIVWKEHEGKKQCFELDERTLHNDVCKNRDQCAHCGQKVRWTLVEGKWLALDAVLTRELHWSFCPKNPEGAKALVARLTRLEAENAYLRKLNPNAPECVEAESGKRQDEVTALRAEVARLNREMKYRDVELHRLTQKAEGATRRGR